MKVFTGGVLLIFAAEYVTLIVQSEYVPTSKGLNVIKLSPLYAVKVVDEHRSQ